MLSWPIDVFFIHLYFLFYVNIKRKFNPNGFILPFCGLFFFGFIFLFAHNSFALKNISRIQKLMVRLLVRFICYFAAFSLSGYFHSCISISFLIHSEILIRCSSFLCSYRRLHLNSRALLFFIFIFSDCVLYAVGKPVYHKSMNVTYGSWLKDAQPRGKVEKIWTTYETDHNIIYQFDDKTEFRNNKAKEIHHLKMPGFQVHFVSNIIIIVRKSGTHSLKFNNCCSF